MREREVERCTLVSQVRGARRITGAENSGQPGEIDLALQSSACAAARRSLKVAVPLGSGQPYLHLDIGIFAGPKRRLYPAEGGKVLERRSIAAAASGKNQLPGANQFCRSNLGIRDGERGQSLAGSREDGRNI